MTKLFSVKTFVMTLSSGLPKIRDAFFNPNVELLEERVLLLKAKSFAQAIKIAERETREYCEREFVSVYGQRVKFKPLKYVVCFELSDEVLGPFGPVSAPVEVFSTTEIVNKQESISAIIERKGGKVRKDEQVLRFKFLEGGLIDSNSVEAIKAKVAKRSRR